MTVLSGTSPGRRDDAPIVRRARGDFGLFGRKRRGDGGSVTTVGLVEEYLWRRSYDATASFCLHPAVTGANRTPPIGDEAGGEGGWDLDPHPRGIARWAYRLLFSRRYSREPRALFASVLATLLLTLFSVGSVLGFLYPNTSSETAASHRRFSWQNKISNSRGYMIDHGGLSSLDLVATRERGWNL